MSSMKLKKLVLQNFQGIKSLEFEPDGADASLYGTNGSGKTTVYNALTWLLFDKASTGEKGFSPKTKDENGEDIHYRNNRVDGTFILDDGAIITFSKDLHENWVKKRGSNIEEFSGNKTDYFIDGVPTTKTDYEARLAEICPTEMAQILTQPEYFPEAMPWQNRRKILLEACGDITEFDVINSSSELSGITMFLLKPGTNGQFYSVEDYQKIAAAKKKDINARIDQIPARIDEAAKAMPDITGLDEAEVKEKIATLQSEREAAAEEKANLSQSDAEQTMRRQLAEINTAIAEGRAKFNEGKSASLSAERGRIAELRNQRQTASYQLQAVKSAISRAKNELADIKQRRERLSAEYKSIKESEWSGDTVCQYCGQSLPADSIEQSRAKFNLHKSNEMERIRTKIEAECSKAIIAELEQVIGADTKTENDLATKIQQCDADIETATEQIRPKEQETYESTEEYREYAAQIAEIQKKMSIGNIDTSESKRALQAKIDGLQERISAEQQKLLLLQTVSQQQKRIDELEAEKKKLNAEYEQLTQGLYLCEEFIKAKVRLLDEKINEKFKSVKFRLFKTQINGGIQEDCEVMIPTPNGLVPYSTANNAARINAGLEIIDTLARHWGITMPVFVDNAESVVKLNKIGSQVIRLVVSEQDETLRMGVE